MGLILAVIAFFATLVVAFLQAFANGMSDAPSQEGLSLWPTFVVGWGLAALLAASHYFHFSW